MIELKDIKLAKIKKGKLYPYLKDITLVGRVDEDEEFIIYGCKTKDESKFYQGILDYDKVDKTHNFKTVKEVENYWIEVGDLLLYLKKGEYILIKKILETD